MIKQPDKNGIILKSKDDVKLRVVMANDIIIKYNAIIIIPTVKKISIIFSFNSNSKYA